MKPINKLLFALFAPVIKIIDFLIPKSEGKILFYGHNGRYLGNVKYLFEYFHKLRSIGDSTWTPIWLTANVEDCSDIERKYGNKYTIHFGSKLENILLIYHLLSVKYIVLTSLGDIFEYRKLLSRRNRKVIHLANGITIKSSGVYVPFFSKVTLNEWITKAKMISHHTVSSELERYFSSSTLLSDPRKFIITGEQRNDQFNFQRENSKAIRKKLELKLGLQETSNDPKFILYAPSHRDVALYGKNEDTAPKYFPFPDLNVEKLIDNMVSNNLHYLIRSHIQDVSFSEGELQGVSKLMRHPNVHNASFDIIPDISEYASAIDMVITDYSGIYLDFLLLGTPVLFVPYDLDLYNKNRGLMFDFSLFTPGPKVTTQMDYLNEIVALLQDNKYYKCERNYVRDIYYEHDDYKACERTVSLLFNDINSQ
jgi:CDP-glycerol glycerophosphotransferase (TagB/SpsB family)